MILRGIFGAAENAFAFLALRYMGLADANVIMFTNPAFTGILACCLLGQKWRYFDYILTISSFAGVLLVVRPREGVHEGRHVPGAQRGLGEGLGARAVDGPLGAPLRQPALQRVAVRGPPAVAPRGALPRRLLPEVLEARAVPGRVACVAELAL